MTGTRAALEEDSPGNIVPAPSRSPHRQRRRRPSRSQPSGWSVRHDQAPARDCAAEAAEIGKRRERIQRFADERVEADLCLAQIFFRLLAFCQRRCETLFGLN